jgi:hypothetical protein
MVEICPDCDIAGCTHIRNRTGVFASKPIEWSVESVEKVARAICEARTWRGAWNKANQAETNAWIEDAKAALSVIAELPEIKGE